MNRIMKHPRAFERLSSSSLLEHELQIGEWQEVTFGRKAGDGSCCRLC